MTDYQKEYRQALRRGDTDEANKIYREQLKEESDEVVEEENGDDEEDLKSPVDMTVGEAKDYAADLEGEALENFYDMEVTGKDRTTLVDHLESELE